MEKGYFCKGSWRQQSRPVHEDFAPHLAIVGGKREISIARQPPRKYIDIHNTAGEILLRGAPKLHINAKTARWPIESCPVAACYASISARFDREAYESCFTSLVDRLSLLALRGNCRSHHAREKPAERADLRTVLVGHTNWQLQVCPLNAIMPIASTSNSVHPDFSVTPLVAPDPTPPLFSRASFSL